MRVPAETHGSRDAAACAAKLAPPPPHSGDPRVYLLCDGQLMDTDEREDLEPASGGHSIDGGDAARDVVKVQV